jgi:hypothetical protein
LLGLPFSFGKFNPFPLTQSLTAKTFSQNLRKKANFVLKLPPGIDFYKENLLLVKPLKFFANWGSKQIVILACLW